MAALESIASGVGRPGRLTVGMGLLLILRGSTILFSLSSKASALLSLGLVGVDAIPRSSSILGCRHGSYNVSFKALLPSSVGTIAGEFA